MIKNNTPVEKYKVGRRTVYVKREDKCTPRPGPPFSKCRGVYAKMKKLKKEGVETVGYVETPISMAGWAVAWCAKKLDMRAVIFDPQYKNKTPIMLQYHRREWWQFSPVVLKIPAGRTCINWQIAKKILNEKYLNALMLPTGLPFQETVEETAKEWVRTMKVIKPDHTVICVGSGTICAGIINGMALRKRKLHGVLICSKNMEAYKDKIWDKAGLLRGGLFGVPDSFFNLVDPGWEYMQEAEMEPPFPCHRYYDQKAWQWLVENLKDLKGKVLFWNIGREHDIK